MNKARSGPFHSALQSLPKRNQALQKPAGLLRTFYQRNCGRMISCDTNDHISLSVVSISIHLSELPGYDYKTLDIFYVPRFQFSKPGSLRIDLLLYHV